jgi:hypothetical protein
MGGKIFSLPLTAIYYNIQDSVAKSKEYIVELNIYIYIYIYIYTHLDTTYSSGLSVYSSQ